MKCMYYEYEYYRHVDNAVQTLGIFKKSGELLLLLIAKDRINIGKV